MQIVLNKTFGEINCGFYEKDNEVWMTREQIGAALEYASPNISIANMHKRYQDRLDQFSVLIKLISTDGKSYDTRVYNTKGIYEICRWSRQTKANTFMDWVWNVVDEYRAGKLLHVQQVPVNENLKKAEILTQLATSFRDILSRPSLELIVSKAAEYIDPALALPRPRIERTYKAREIAKELGVTPQRIGRVSNANNLKTPDHGYFILDKAINSDKQVLNFIYNEQGKEAIRKLISG